MEEDGADGDEKECQDTWPEHEDPKVCVPNAEVAEWEEDGEDLAAPEDDLWEQEEEEEAEEEAFEEAWADAEALHAEDGRGTMIPAETSWQPIYGLPACEQAWAKRAEMEEDGQPEQQKRWEEAGQTKDEEVWEEADQTKHQKVWEEAGQSKKGEVWEEADQWKEAAQFKEGEVWEEAAQFKDGEVWEEAPQFKEGEVWEAAQFKDGEVWEEAPQFKEGEVWEAAQFKDGEVWEEAPQFKEGEVWEEAPQFKEGEVWEEAPQFKEGEVWEEAPQFKEGEVWEEAPQFKEGEVWKEAPQFKEGEVWEEGNPLAAPGTGNDGSSEDWAGPEDVSPPPSSPSPVAIKPKPSKKAENPSPSKKPSNEQEWPSPEQQMELAQWWRKYHVKKTSPEASPISFHYSVWILCSFVCSFSFLMRISSATKDVPGAEWTNGTWDEAGLKFMLVQVQLQITNGFNFEWPADLFCVLSPCQFEWCVSEFSDRRGGLKRLAMASTLLASIPPELPLCDPALSLPSPHIHSR